MALWCGAARKTDSALTSLWLVPRVSVKWTWAGPRAEIEAVRRDRRLFETATPRRRGRFDRVERRIEVSDAFRLTKITLVHREPRSVHCLPSVGALRSVNVVRSMSSGDSLPNPTSPAEGDRSDLRRYSPGDPVRFILWRVFARTRQLVVKSPERAQSIATKAVAYLVAGEADEAAAGAARLALESGALGKDWTFGADGSKEDATTLDGAHVLLAASARTPPSAAGAGLSSFLERNATAGRVLVFVPAKEGDWLVKTMQAVLKRGGQSAPPNVEFLVCCDGIDRSEEPTWLRRLRVADEESTKTGHEIVSLATVTSVLRMLAGTRARVLLLDRRSGRMHDAGEHLRLVRDGRALVKKPAAPVAQRSTA